MSFVDPITGGEQLAGKITDLIGKFVPDKTQAAQLQFQMFQIVANANATQAAITQEYARSASLFLSGPRPALLWIGVFYFAYSYVFIPILMYVTYATGHPIPKPPNLDDHLYELVTMLLGLGAMRSYDKNTVVNKLSNGH